MREASTVPAQGLRFALAGSAVALLYLVVTIGLADGLGVSFQLALILGFTSALAAHFSLQRVFVWVHQAEFALPVHRQAARYLVVAACQYAATALATAILPHALGVSVTVVYVATAVAIPVFNFLFFRTRVFHAQDATELCTVAEMDLTRERRSAGDG